MTEQPCYKEDSLQDFASWAEACGHYAIAPLVRNYRAYVTGEKEEHFDPDDE